MVKKKRRWFTNKAGTMSTIIKPIVALSPAEMNWLEKKAIADKQTVNEVLYHLTKAAIDRQMQAEGEWSE